MLQAAEAVQVEPLEDRTSAHIRGGSGGAVEASRHEVSQIAVLEQVGLRHIDACISRQTGIRELDAAPRTGAAGGAHAQPGRVAAGAIELDEPQLLPGPWAGEPRAHTSRRAIPENQRLGPGAPRASSHLHHLRHRNRDIALDDTARLLDERSHFEGFFRPGAGVVRGAELQGTHRAISHVEQPLERRQRVPGAPPGREIAADHGVAEPVRQRVGEHAGQSEEGGLAGEFREGNRSGTRQRQVDRRDLKSRVPEPAVVLERDPPALRLEEKTHVASPQPHADRRVSVHDSRSGGGVRLDARWRGLPLICSIS